jgi:D-alanine-D-alanine ligase
MNPMDFFATLKTLRRPKNIWVFYGGISAEREVSLKTGKGVADALKKGGFSVELFDVNPAALETLPWKQSPDLVFLGLHGTWAEDGVIQGYLETRGVRYVGSGVLASALCFHKGLTKTALRMAGLPTPASFEFSGQEEFETLLREARFTAKDFSRKFFIKPAREGSTVGIERFDPTAVANPESLFREKLSSVFKFDQDVVVEEWVEGPELTVPVLAGKALEIVEIRPKSQFYDYSSKYTAGATDYFCPAPLDPAQTRRIKEISEKAFRVLKCADYGRLDVMLGKSGPMILEMNTLPGMTGTSLVPKSAIASGFSYETFCEFLACYSYDRQLSVGGKK